MIITAMQKNKLIKDHGKAFLDFHFLESKTANKDEYKYIFRTYMEPAINESLPIQVCFLMLLAGYFCEGTSSISCSIT